MDRPDDIGRAVAEEILSHYGVKGMRWGVRNKSSEPASDDAVRTNTINTRAKASGTKALTNAELQAAINRMNLEQQYNRVKPRSPAARVLRFVGSQLGLVAKEQGTRLLRDQATTLVTKAVESRR